MKNVILKFYANKKIFNPLIYLLVIALPLVILTIILKLWKCKINIPLTFLSGDALSTGALIKTIGDYGWYWHNLSIGAPFGFCYHVSPAPYNDNLQFLLMKFIFLFANDWASVYNLYYLLTYSLCALTAFIALRQLRVSNLLAIGFSLLYAFLPYHFYRGMHHLFLSAYFMAPVAVMLCVWLFQEKIEFFSYDRSTKKITLHFNKRSILAMMLCVLAASTGAYYAFYAMIIIAATGTLLFFLRKKTKHLINSLLLAAIIIGTIFVNFLPIMLYQQKNPDFKLASIRHHYETDLFSLRMSFMFIPHGGHRIKKFQEINARYYNQLPVLNENTAVPVGILGSIGFAILILLLFFGKNNHDDLTLADNKNAIFLLSRLHIILLLFAVMSGFCSLFSFFIMSSLRAHNRVVVYLVFFYFSALALTIELIRQKLIKKNITFNYIINPVIIMLIVFGLFDQTSRSYIPNYPHIAAEYTHNKNFINSIEAMMPKNAMIYQLPFMFFLENNPVHKVDDYAHFEAYLHSKTLRWSYGVVRGGPGAQWLQDVSKLNAVDMVKTLRNKGYSGIYIDRFGYKDMAKGLEQKLSAILKIKPLESQNKRHAFFNLLESGK